MKTTESGLQYRILQEGTGNPNDEDFVTAHYQGTLTDGAEFDSSYTRGEPQKLETDGVIGVDRSAPDDEGGPKVEDFRAPAVLAYGKLACPRRSRPTRALVFEIELLRLTKRSRRRMKREQ